jgi:hypothetical protein
VGDLKTLRIKNQEIILESEDEYDDETIGTQVEENTEREDDDMHTSEDKEDIQEEIREEFTRRDTKTPSRITRKNHLEELIIGDMNDEVHTRRQLLSNRNSIVVTY